MPGIKIATWNIEWMVSLFGGLANGWTPPGIPDTFPGRKLGEIRLEPIADVPALCRRIAGVIRDLDAKIIGIQEGPPLKAQLEVFVDRFLGGDYVVHQSRAVPVWQTVCALVHKSIAAKATAWTPAPEPSWKGMSYYPWGTLAATDRKKHNFARYPLLLSFKPSAKRELGIVILHTKSKFSSLDAAKWLARDPDAVRDALDSRTKLSTEVMRLRDVLSNAFLKDDPRSLVIMGDLNDGPLADELEREFMIHNIVDELIGNVLSPFTYLRHAMAPARLATAASTSFPDPLAGGVIVPELIDHMLVSPAIWQQSGAFRIKADSCRVEDAIYAKWNADTDPPADRGLRPSDHKPVSLQIEW